MDVFYFALCACYAAFVAVQLELASTYFSPGQRKLSIGLSFGGLVFLAHSILAVHSQANFVLPGLVLALILMTGALGFGVFTVVRPVHSGTADERLFALLALATGLIHWFPVVAFAALGLFSVLFLGLFLRNRARVLSREVRRHWLFPLLAVMVILILTSLAAVSQQREKGRQMREGLLLQTRLVANAITPADFDRLEYTLADESNVVYRRICRQMTAFAQVMGHRSIYSQVVRNGQIRFGPESLDPADPMASRPGTVYEQPTFSNYLVFWTAQPLTVGPYRDEYGTFVSAFVPVLDRTTRKIRVVIGMDIETPTWEKTLGWARLQPLLFGFLGLLLVFFSQRALSHAATRKDPGPLWNRHAHAFFAFLLGVLLTVYLARAAFTEEEHTQRVTFWQLALSQSTRIQEAFNGIEEKELQSLVRFFESSDLVKRSEFENFTREMNQLPYVLAWSYSPRVPVGRLNAHQAKVHAMGRPHYTVYRLPGPAGTTLYPVMYVEPFQPNIVMLGLDLLSEPVIAEAILHAEATGQSAISDSFPILHETGSDLGAAIVHPIFSPSTMDSSPPDGMVAATIRFDVFLRSVVHWMNPLGQARMQVFSVDLYQLESGQSPTFLSTTRRVEPRFFERFFGQPEKMTVTVPIFVLGKAYLLVFRPNQLFSQIYPERAGWLTLLLGLILTFALTLLIGIILSWQRRLRQELDRQSSGRRSSEKKFHTLVEKAPVAVVVVINNTIQYANSAALQLLESSATESILGLDFCDFLADQSRQRVIDLLEDVDTAASTTLDVVIHGAAGETPCEVSTVRITVEETRGFLLFIRNLTAQILAQVENERLQTQLAQSQKMETISRLAGGVAHDFNNMLGVILGSADILIDHMESQDPNRRDVLEIQVAASRASDMMRRLLAFARRQESQPVIMDLNKRVKGQLGKLSSLIGEQVELRWEPAETLWLVSLDPFQLDQMLSIALSNASEAVEGGGTITLKTFNIVRSRPETGQTNEYVVMSIADTGAGMDTATLGHLFEPFFSTKQPGEHTGLGLAMLHGIVSQNGGFIEVRSRPGEGSTFEIHLPKAFSTGRISRPIDVASPAGRERAPSQPTGVELILFVEDEEANLRIGQRILERAGYTVLPASGASAALEILEKTDRTLHAMICDVALQKMSARELVEAVRRRFPDIGVLYVSGYPEDMVLDRGWMQEGQRFLSKPFTGAQLLEAMRSLHG